MTTREALARSLERLYAEQRAREHTMSQVQKAALYELESMYHLLDRSPRTLDRWAELLDEEMGK